MKTETITTVKKTDPKCGKVTITHFQEYELQSDGGSIHVGNIPKGELEKLCKDKGWKLVPVNH